MSSLTYNNVYNLIGDISLSITNIMLECYTKMQEIQRNATDSNPTVNIKYTYDASGNRISKKVTDNSGNVIYTWYVRDAQGNMMSAYTSTGTGSTLGSYTVDLSEQYLYGSSRLGIMSRDVDMKAGYTQEDIVSFYRGYKQYELSNHLGNVLVTITDKKTSVSTNGTTIDNYTADVSNANDYYSGGMLMPGRTYTSGAPYHYSINGQEKTPEIAPNTTTAEFWQYDARVVRRWNIDPKPNMSISPYNCFNGNPIWFSDIKGDTIRGNTVNMATYNQYRSDINSKIASTKNGITNAQNRLNAATNNRQKRRATNDLNNLNNKLGELNTINSELNALESSSQDYVLSSVNNSGSNIGGTTSFAATMSVNGQTYTGAIKIGFNRAHNPLASLSHELKHAFQWESLNWIEDLSYNSTFSPYTHSLANEIEAYQREYFYAGSLNDIDASGNAVPVTNKSQIDAAFVLRRGYSTIASTSSTTVTLPSTLRAQAAAHNRTQISNQAVRCTSCDWRGISNLILYNGWKADARVQ